MTGYMEGAIKDFSLGIFDGPHATPKEAETGPIFLGIKNITPDGRLNLSEVRHISEEEFPKWTRRVIPQAGDIVFSYEATLHLYALIPEGFRGCLGRRLALIRPNPKSVDNRFLLFYFISPGWRKVVEGSIISGATVDRVPLIRFPHFPVRIPPIHVQRKIGDVLSAYDDLIENNLRRIALLEESARLLYKEWFVRLRFPGHKHAPIINGIPKGWEQGRLEQALILQRGFDLPAQNRVEGDIPIYASTGQAGFHNKAMVRGPGVVTGRSGTLGVVKYVSEDFWPLNTTLWVKEFKRVTPVFAYFLLTELQLEQYNGGVSVPTLDRKVVHRLPIPIPNRNLIDLFDDYINPFFTLIRTLLKQNEKLKIARDLLLPRLMSGEIAV